MSLRFLATPELRSADHVVRLGRLRRAAKVFEGIFFLLFIGVPLAIAAHFDVVPIFGSRQIAPAMLTSTPSYVVAVAGYLLLALAGVTRIVQGFDARELWPYDTILWLLAAVGVACLCAAVVLAMHSA